jgi:hypothetical protein
MTLVPINVLTTVIVDWFVAQLILRKFKQHNMEGPLTNSHHSIVSWFGEPIKYV